MARGRIRVRLKSYDHRVLDSTCESLLDTALRTGAKVVGPIPLPSTRTVFVVNKAAFIDKDNHFIRIRKVFYITSVQKVTQKSRFIYK